MSKNSIRLEISIEGLVFEYSGVRSFEQDPNGTFWIYFDKKNFPAGVIINRKVKVLTGYVTNLDINYNRKEDMRLIGINIEKFDGKINFME